MFGKIRKSTQKFILGFKNKLPVRLKCRNCETDMHGRYCHVCGQDLFAGTEGSKGFILNIIDCLFAYDNKLPITLFYLLFYPGKLAREYNLGRIVNYVYPSKLFWFASLIFFMLFFSFVDTIVKKTFEKGSQVEITETKKDSTASAVSEIPGGESEKEELKVRDQQLVKDEKLFVKLSKNLEKYREIKDTLSLIAPFVVLILIPVFAFFMYLSYRKKYPRFSDHLVFALHFHTFVMILLIICMLLRNFFSQISIHPGVILWTPLIYFLIAVRVFYRPRIIPAVFKIALIGCFYPAIILIAMTLISIYLIVKFYPHIMNR